MSVRASCSRVAIRSTPSLRSDLPDTAIVVAADSGLHLAETLGLHVDRIVGDLDSADPDLVEAAVARGAVIERHPAEKDATDLELALDAAVREGAQRVVVVGGGGGRLDHFLANVLLITTPRVGGSAHRDALRWSACIRRARTTAGVRVRGVAREPGDVAARRRGGARRS